MHERSELRGCGEGIRAARMRRGEGITRARRTAELGSEKVRWKEPTPSSVVCVPVITHMRARASTRTRSDAGSSACMRSAICSVPSGRRDRSMPRPRPRCTNGSPKRPNNPCASLSMASNGSSSSSSSSSPKKMSGAPIPSSMLRWSSSRGLTGMNGRVRSSVPGWVTCSAGRRKIGGRVIENGPSSPSPTGAARAGARRVSSTVGSMRGVRAYAKQSACSSGSSRLPYLPGR